MHCVRYNEKRKVFRSRGKLPQNTSDLECSLVTSSRPPGRPQDDVAAQAADGSQRTAGAADEQCPRCGCSSLSCTVVPCAVDIGEPLSTACRPIAPAREQNIENYLIYM